MKLVPWVEVSEWHVFTYLPDDDAVFGSNGDSGESARQQPRQSAPRPSAGTREADQMGNLGKQIARPSQSVVTQNAQLKPRQVNQKVLRKASPNYISGNTQGDEKNTEAEVRKVLEARKAEVRANRDMNSPLSVSSKEVPEREQVRDVLHSGATSESEAMDTSQISSTSQEVIERIRIAEALKMRESVKEQGGYEKLVADGRNGAQEKLGQIQQQNQQMPNVEQAIQQKSAVEQVAVAAVTDQVVKLDDAQLAAKLLIREKTPVIQKSISTSSEQEPNWLLDRYQLATMQRNLMVILNILALVCVVASTVSATKIIASKSLDPFVIEIDKKSGIVTLVDQEQVKLFTPNEAITNHFLLSYLRARELFDPRNYRSFYYKDVRLMSDEKVYKSFLRVLRTDGKQNPMIAYAGNMSCSLMVRSMQYLQPNSVQIRFTVEAEMPSGKIMTRSRIVTMGFKYAPVQLSEEERYINPLGFTVTNYNSSDEVM